MKFVDEAIACLVLAWLATMLVLCGCQGTPGPIEVADATQQQKWAAARATLTASQDIAVVVHKDAGMSDAAIELLASTFDSARSELDATASKTNISDILAKAVAAAKAAAIAAIAANIVAHANTLTPDDIAVIAANGKTSDKAFLAYMSSVTGK